MTKEELLDEIGCLKDEIKKLHIVIGNHCDEIVLKDKLIKKLRIKLINENFND